MAITDKKEGVWDTEEAYNKKNAGYWDYDSRGEGKSLWAWGRNYFGQLGLNNTALDLSYSSPTQVGTDTTWASLQGSGSHTTFAIKSDGTLWAWGSNPNGSLALNQPSNERVSSPTQVGTESNWRSIGSIAQDSFYATKFDGTLWTWGSNEIGALGLNQNDVHRSSPTQVGTDTTWNIINHGSARQTDLSLAIKNDGSLWAWGRGQYGSFGGSRINSSSPVQVGTDTTWKSFNTSYYSVAATKTDGTLWTWGPNPTGQLGLNQTTSPANTGISSPTQVGTDTTWDTIASSAYNSFLALKTDGSLWAWGDNVAPSAKNGWLGVGDIVQRSSPTQVLSGTGWSDTVIGGYYSSGAIKTDGTLWTWGSNEYGDLGQNLPWTSRRSSPTQVGTDTNWYPRTGVDPHYVRTITHNTNGMMVLRTPS